MKARVCTGTKKDGSPCGNIATPDGLCFAHSPACRDKTAAARVAGGRNSSTAARARKAMSATAQELSRLVEHAMADVLSGAITPGQAQGIASLTGAWCRLHEYGEMAAEVADLRARLEARPSWRG